jgi:hypothetical protein
LAGFHNGIENSLNILFSSVEAFIDIRVLIGWKS